MLKDQNKIKAKKHFQKVIDSVAGCYNNAGATLIDLKIF